MMSAKDEKRIKELENESIKNSIDNGKLNRKVNELDDLLHEATNKIYHLQETISAMQGKILILESRSLKTKEPRSWFDKIKSKIK